MKTPIERITIDVLYADDDVRKIVGYRIVEFGEIHIEEQIISDPSDVAVVVENILKGGVL